MPQRRHHTKSRHGCERCKRRRIKCDETGPPCGHCSARNADCKYRDRLLHQFHLGVSLEEPGERWTEETVQPTPNPATIPDHDNPSNTPSTTDRMRELQLMHFWCTKTCHSFSPSLSPIFQDDVVQQALRHPFLMDSLLALTSLHMAIDQSDIKHPLSYPSEALLYQNRAVPSFRTALESISPSNCNALFACSTIMMACAAVSPYFQPPHHEPATQNHDNHRELTLLFPFVKGIHSVIEEARPWLSGGPFQSAILIHSEEEWNRTYSVEDSTLPSALWILFHGQEQDWVIFGDSSPGIQSIYERAIGLLDACSRDESMVIPWIVLVGKDFIDPVQTGEPVALLIYICWGALLGRLDRIWWARVAGRTIVRHISGLTPVEHAAWDEIMAWAKEMIE